MSIIFGIALYIAFHKFALTWWMMNTFKEDLERPIVFFNPWFFPTAFLISIGLFIASIVCFWSFTPWLAVVPVLLLLTSVLRIRARRGALLNRAIQIAANCQVQLIAQQANQATINQEIMRRIFGEQEALRDSYSDWDTKLLLKCVVLPRLGLYKVQDDMQRMMRNFDQPSNGDRIDALFDTYIRITRNINPVGRPS